jgi:RNA polymerase sigma-70 factor (ECF subfamily)
MSSSADHPEILIQRARAGDVAALGRLLEYYRGYLKLMAGSLIRFELRAHIAASDVVQETFLEAHRDFATFAGLDEAVLVAWLRRILVRNLANQADYLYAGRRDVRRQRSIEQVLEHSSCALHAALASPVSSPSLRAIHREEAVLLAEALERIPADYREVFILHNLEGVSFDDIAARLGRTPQAVRKLWGRAILKLSRLLGERHE